ncbi:hypothetical protein CBER1_02125 [Cercospora berteroae]|uniref:Major facilitator superfamily (MFS) profile domain-containing protein n=1 Tax=Cercospora berteroae TaxID=357750 RepID=A0A2S6C8L6_9PEZI|nr:hypothetical protein CBER1_02125 [Cercospora berteroae]
MAQDNLEQIQSASSDRIDDEKSSEYDTIHGDEAAKVLGSYDGPREWDPAEEKRLVRRIDKKLMPILFFTYGLQFYDEQMLSQAAIFGMRDELALRVDNRYSFASAIFYLGFISGAYPAIVLTQRYPIEKVMFLIVLLWGICLISTAAVTNFQGLYAQRFFLGCLEAGVSPGWMMIVGGWYRKDEQAFRVGIWYSAVGFSNIISALVNWGLGHVSGSLSPWQYMYLVAGAVIILWAFVILFYLPPDPIRVKSFTEREHYIAVARLKENNSGVRNTQSKKEQAMELLRDEKFWLLFLTTLTLLFVNGPTTSFIPIIIQQLGFTGFTSLLLLLPGGFILGCVQLIVSYCAMKFKNIRTWLVAAMAGVSLLACVLLRQLPIEQTGARLFALFIVGWWGGGYAVLMGLSMANCAGYTKRSATSSGIFVAFCLGNFFGPLTFLESEAPYYTTGWNIMIVTLVISICSIVAYRFVCIWTNKRRDASGSAEGFDNAYQDNLTDKKNEQFRYTL